MPKLIYIAGKYTGKTKVDSGSECNINLWHIESLLRQARRKTQGYKDDA